MGFKPAGFLLFCTEKWDKIIVHVDCRNANDVMVIMLMMETMQTPEAPDWHLWPLKPHQQILGILW